MSVSGTTDRPGCEHWVMGELDVLRGVPFLAGDGSGAAAAGRTVDVAPPDEGRVPLPVRRPGVPALRHRPGPDRSHRTSTHGTPLLFHVATAGETPGQVDLPHRAEYTAFAQALSAADVLAVPAAACIELLESEPAAMSVYARDLAAVVRVVTESLADLVFLDLERRLARTLNDAPADGDRVTLTMTQSELAARLGVARQSLNQALSKLASRGLVVLESARVVEIVDRSALAVVVKSPCCGDRTPRGWSDGQVGSVVRQPSGWSAHAATTRLMSMNRAASAMTACHSGVVSARAADSRSSNHSSPRPAYGGSSPSGPGRQRFCS